MVKGGDWNYFDSDPAEATIRITSIFGPGDTHVATTANLDYNNKKSLSDSGLKLGQISGGQSIPVYFQLRVPTVWFDNYFTPPMGVNQEVSIDLLC